MRRGAWTPVGAVLPSIPFRSFTSGRGESQTRRTLQVMAYVAARAAVDPELVATAANIVRQLSGRDPSAQVEAIEAWSRSRLSFLSDPLMDGDYIRTPAYLLAEIREYGEARGDCDDAAVLVAALGLAVGIPARIRAVAFAAGEPFSHVWTELATPRGWIAVDPTRDEPLYHVDRSLVVEV